MKHLPNKYDVITDLRRSLSSSYSEAGFNDVNATIFLQKAEENLDKVARNMDGKTLSIIKQRITRAKNESSHINKRREDLLMASCLLES